MCGIVGMIGQSVNHDLYDALTIIQHRGQDAAGIMTSDGKRFHIRKSNGLVRDAIRDTHMLNLKGDIGIGHVRYPTAGTESAAEAQPFFVNSPFGLGMVHNGNLINAKTLTQDVLAADKRHLNTESDSEVLLNVFAHALQSQAGHKLTPEMIFNAVSTVHERCVGSYAVIILVSGFGLVAFRDPHGIRPLVYGKRDNNTYLITSESVALDVLGFTRIADVAAGEAICITDAGDLYKNQCAKKPELNPCIFETVYLARPDSILDDISVHHFRKYLGRTLGEKILKIFPYHDIDVVIPIPDTSRTYALPLAKKLNVKYREGFVKNRYIGRTFIMPGQKKRKKSVRQKLNAINSQFKDRVVLLVDDSIVRGTTSKEIIQMAREAGAKKVYFASAAPEVRYQNIYGIDMPSQAELIAYNRSVEEIRDAIGADWLIFQDLEALYDAGKRCNPSITRYEDSIFTGDYITGQVSQEYLDKLARERES